MRDAISQILEIITNNFPNGIRDDFIDMNRVAKIYSENHAGENISRDFVADFIRANGIEKDGRFYFIFGAASEKLLRFIAEILDSSFIAYYSKIYECHANFFESLHIFSPEVLRKILQRIDIDKEHFYFSDFCSARKMKWADYEAAEWLENEVARIFIAADKALALEDLQEKIPYVPAEKISEVLSDAQKYFPTRDGKYLPNSKIQFDIDEIRAAKRKIIASINANGCASTEEFSLASNFALNPELSEKDLRRLIYGRFFSDLTIRGKKFYRQGAATSTSQTKTLREFIAGQNELTANKLFAFAESIGAAVHVTLSVAYETMVRVDKNLFVKDAMIKFDVAAIDEALAPFVQKKIISLQSVTSFTGFPPVEGYSWNLFLLESFLRKFSEKYVYVKPATNSSNLGAIHPSAMKFKDYLDVQAAVILQENVPLEKSAVDEFLMNHGFRGKRRDKVIARIIARAQEFIEESF
ncbi:MAG: hypothetical protein J5809_00090 [Selenomonadaceae bacterium]|nr:hypothetical protein [Selenomonadaceae bacterium]